MKRGNNCGVQFARTPQNLLAFIENGFVEDRKKPGVILELLEWHHADRTLLTPGEQARLEKLMLGMVEH